MLIARGQTPLYQLYTVASKPLGRPLAVETDVWDPAGSVVSFSQPQLGLAECECDKLSLRLVWVLNFNKYCSIFVLFDKKFLILD
jgi:hypothetical protein